MKISNIQLDKIRKNDPFKVPEGYFEEFTARVMEQLPELSVEKPKMTNLWERVKPYIYMAALFAGISLMVNLFTRESDHRRDIISVCASEGLKLSSSNDIDDFYIYYEDELTKVIYDDTMADFLGDIDTDYNHLSKK
jgi:hypothetical protein